jgi:hypothetical protein
MEMLRCRRLLTDWQVSLLAEHSHLVVPRHIQKRRRRRHTTLDYCYCDWAGSPNSRSILHTATLLLGYTLLSPYNIHPSIQQRSAARPDRNTRCRAAQARSINIPTPLLSPFSRIKCVLCVYMCCVFFSYQLNRTEINKISCVYDGLNSCFFFFLEGLYYTHTNIWWPRIKVSTHMFRHCPCLFRKDVQVNFSCRRHAGCPIFGIWFGSSISTTTI